jgi:hypothetical protein
MSKDVPVTAEVTPIFESFQFEKEFGVIRLENWPEGIVLWVGGQIRWRSWREAEFCATRLPERKAAAEEIRAIGRAINGE